VPFTSCEGCKALIHKKSGLGNRRGAVTDACKLHDVLKAGWQLARTVRCDGAAGRPARPGVCLARVVLTLLLAPRADRALGDLHRQEDSMNRTNATPLCALAASIALAFAVPGVAAEQAQQRYDDSRTSAQQRSDNRLTTRRDFTTERANQSASDARREAAIATTFMTNPQLRSSDIDVEVNNATAILTGTVESRVEHNLAEQIAMNVSGINRVDNQLRVDSSYRATARTGTDRDFGTAVADATITAQVKSKLLWNTNTDGLDIDVDTRNGRVTLSGSVDNAQARDIAERLANNTNGVTAVNNRLTVDRNAERTVARIDEDRDDRALRTAARTDRDDRMADRHDRTADRHDTMKHRDDRQTTASTRNTLRDRDDRAEPVVNDTWISTKVKSTLLLSRNVPGTAIEVDTNNGVVALSGTVDSTAERQLAIELARDIRGVRQVDASGLTVSRSDRAVAADDDDR
jgi:hyperosmotically inducible periplasmic protein